jgi:6-pyruvoyltetrahydropterin/6-carboxytetrahydropterin synthase
MPGSFTVSLEKEQLIFSAAHFITFGDNICERLHGHNYRVACEVSGALNHQAYVIDFIALRDSLQQVVAELDHHVLLPTQHPTIQVTRLDSEVEARFENRRWLFPAEDCCLLPIDNTTAERLAEYIAGRILPIVQAQTTELQTLVVAVDENEGQWGKYRLDF